MNVDLGFVLYLENAILTAGALLAHIHQNGHTIWQFKNEPDDAPPPYVIGVFAAALWPVTWIVWAVVLVAKMIEKLGKQTA